jgi:hypothetical protein
MKEVSPMEPVSYDDHASCVVQLGILWSSGERNHGRGLC